jgi:hypothetical protein
LNIPSFSVETWLFETCLERQQQCLFVQRTSEFAEAEEQSRKNLIHKYCFDIYMYEYLWLIRHWHLQAHEIGHSCKSFRVNCRYAPEFQYQFTSALRSVARAATGEIALVGTKELTI